MLVFMEHVAHFPLHLTAFHAKDNCNRKSILVASKTTDYPRIFSTNCAKFWESAETSIAVEILIHFNQFNNIPVIPSTTSQPSSLIFKCANINTIKVPIPFWNVFAGFLEQPPHCGLCVGDHEPGSVPEVCHLCCWDSWWYDRGHQNMMLCVVWARSKW